MSSALSSLRGGKDELRDKMVLLPRGLINPRVGVANVQGLGVSVVVVDDLIAPLVWNPKEKRWVELQA